MKKVKQEVYGHHFTLQYDDGWRTGGDSQFEVKEILTKEFIDAFTKQNHDVLLILWKGVVDLHDALTPADIKRIVPGLGKGDRVEPYLWVFWDHGAPTAEVVMDGVVQVAHRAMGCPLKKLKCPCRPVCRLYAKVPPRRCARRSYDPAYT
jgi:hypothetical protein